MLSKQSIATGAISTRIRRSDVYELNNSIRPSCEFFAKRIVHALVNEEVSKEDMVGRRSIMSAFVIEGTVSEDNRDRRFDTFEQLLEHYLVETSVDPRMNFIDSLDHEVSAQDVIKAKANIFLTLIHDYYMNEQYANDLFKYAESYEDLSLEDQREVRSSIKRLLEEHISTVESISVYAALLATLKEEIPLEDLLLGLMILYTKVESKIIVDGTFVQRLNIFEELSHEYQYGTWSDALRTAYLFVFHDINLYDESIGDRTLYGLVEESIFIEDYFWFDPGDGVLLATIMIKQYLDMRSRMASSIHRSSTDIHKSIDSKQSIKGTIDDPHIDMDVTTHGNMGIHESLDMYYEVVPSFNGMNFKLRAKLDEPHAKIQQQLEDKQDIKSSIESDTKIATGIETVRSSLKRDRR